MRILPLLSLCALCSPLYADNLPSFLNSNDTVRTLPTPNLPADAYRPQGTAPQLPQPAASQGTPALMGTRVTIGKLQIEGGTIYPLPELAAYYQPLMGHETTLAELIEATRNITRRYQQDGYLLSYAFLPPQHFEQGRVRVVLVEGYIRDYQLSGDIGAVSGLLDEWVAKLKAERPLTRKTFERYTSLMSRIPGVTLQAQVPPPGTTDGATSLIAIAGRKPFTTSLNTVDSSRDGLQALLGASSNAWTAMGEQVSVSGLFPPGRDQQQYWRIDYSQFLNAEGTQLGVSGSRYRSTPDSNLVLGGNLELKPHRQNERFSIGVSHPLIAASNEWLSLGGRLYAVNDKTRYQVVGQPLKVEDKTDLRALAFEGEWRKSDAERLRILSAGVYRGIHGLGASTDNALYDLDFLRLRLSAVQSDTFFERWQGVVSAALYWSRDSLPDSERAVFGGQNFGRGYPSDQGNGDKGWGVAYELNYRFDRDGAWVKVLQPYVVVNRARAWFNDAPIKAADLSSAAVGLRFGDGRYYNIALEAARPMSDMALDTFNRRPRYTLSFSYQL